MGDGGATCGATMNRSGVSTFTTNITGATPAKNRHNSRMKRREPGQQSAYRACARCTRAHARARAYAHLGALTALYRVVSCLLL